MIRGRFGLEDIGVRNFRGLAEPIPLFRVTGKLNRPIESTARSVQGRSEVIGRDMEFERLRSTWDSVLAKSRASVALITGEPGIGKSRLTEKLSEHIQATGRTIEFRCSPIFRRSPLHPLVECMRQAFDFDSNDSSESRRTRLLDGLMIAGLGDHISLFETLLFPGELSGPQPPPMPSPDSWNTLQGALLTWLRHQILGRPTLIVWEDIHWIDSLSLKILQSLYAELSDSPVFILITSREEIPVASTDGQAIVEINLQPLSSDQSSQLIDTVVEGRLLPAGLKNQLMARGEGIPLFLRELTRMVLDSDISQASKRGEQDGPAAGREPAIPATLQDLLVARLDRLTRKTVLCFAAALGREFDYELLGQVSALKKEELDAELSELLKSGILVRRNIGARTSYAFSHALYREAAYNSMLRSFRRSVHTRIGDALSDLLTVGRTAIRREPGELLPSLAHHWSRAVDRSKPDLNRVEKAVGALIKSADIHLALSGYSESESQLIEAKEFLSMMPESRHRDELELAVELRLSTVFKVRLGWASTEVKATYDRSHELCLKLGDRPELGQVLYGQWSFYLGQGRVSESLTAAHEIAQLSKRGSNSNFTVQAHAALANSQFWMCQLKECIESAECGLDAYSANFLESDLNSFGQDPRIHALQSLTWSLWMVGNAKASVSRVNHMIQLAEEIGHPFGLANALLTKCNLDLLRRDCAGVGTAAAQLSELSERHGFLEYTFHASFFHAWSQACMGDCGELIEKVSAGYEMYKAHGGVARTLAAWVTADILRMDGQQVRCLEILEEALSAWTQEEVVYEAGLLWMKGKILAERPHGDQAEAEDALNRSIQLGIARGQVPFVLRSAVELHRLEQRAGLQIEQPRELLEEYVRRFEGDNEPDLQDARSLLAELLSH